MTVEEYERTDEEEEDLGLKDMKVEGYGEGEGEEGEEAKKEGTTGAAPGDRSMMEIVVCCVD